MLKSQRDTTALCIRHTESKPVERLFVHHDEDALREAIMRTDKAAKGGKVPTKKTVHVAITQERARARAAMDAIERVLREHGPMSRGEIGLRIRAEVKPQIVSNWLRTMREEGRVKCTRQKVNLWSVVE